MSEACKKYMKKKIDLVKFQWSSSEILWQSYLSFETFLYAKVTYNVFSKKFGYIK